MVGDEDEREEVSAGEEGEVTPALAPEQHDAGGVEEVEPEGRLRPVEADIRGPDGGKGSPREVDIISGGEVGKEVAVLVGIHEEEEERRQDHRQHGQETPAEERQRVGTRLGVPVIEHSQNRIGDEDQ